MAPYSAMVGVSMLVVQMVCLAGVQATDLSSSCKGTNCDATKEDDGVTLLQGRTGVQKPAQAPSPGQKSFGDGRVPKMSDRRVQLGIVGSLALAFLLLLVKCFQPSGTVIKAGLLGFSYIGVSACMIESNKWLMLPGHFPYPVALTTNHMLTSFMLANCLRIFCPSAFPALEKLEVTPWFCLKFLPIGAAFAISIVCGNAAYGYLSVSFLQIMKQSNIVVIYSLSVLCGLEALRRCSVVLLIVTVSGTMLAVHGEMHFKLTGFLLQLVSTLSEAAKVIIQGVLMSGTYKLDPMTMVLFMAPACLVANVVPFLVHEVPRISEIGAQFSAHLPFILFNACLAFILNLLVAQCIKQLSPVGYLLCGIVKDVAIIITSSFFLGESMSIQEVCGFCMALSGVACYSLYKQNADCFQEDDILLGFSRVSARLFRGHGKEGMEVQKGDLLKEDDQIIDSKNEDSCDEGKTAADATKA